ncbi:unnamed protein product [Acanthoscelides obtectus]|uniref:Uncharacterized protein n=1 Tax=Acanthoscelides obtectus TaxID=200917 RepID=A0A9P0KWK5_ACAOB|nr:unnamed protein product [Acanthoscelides obtectus]CAK1628620.1 hypothetical protein AOBTE_LOCUS5312 [Acanthoscelides obtectus]
MESFRDIEDQRTCKHKPKVKMSLYNEKHQSRSQRMVDIAKKNKTENSNINDDVATTTDDNKKIIILKNDVIQKPHCGLVSEQVVNNQEIKIKTNTSLLINNQWNL